MEKINEKAEKLSERWRSLDRLYEEYAKAAGLNYASLFVLENICENQNSCTQKMICELTYYPKQSVNLIIKSLWENRYIELKEMPSDRRNKYIYLTEKGKQYAREIVYPLWHAHEQVITRMGQAQYEEFLRMMALYEETYREQIENIVHTELKNKENEHE